MIVGQSYKHFKIVNYHSTVLRGFICAYHPAAPGSNPKHTIYTFFNLC